MDDLGARHVSMQKLMHLRFFQVKIDKAFAMAAIQSCEARGVIKSMVGLAQNFNLRITAEGVDDERTLTNIRNMGCDHAQGFLICRAITADEVWLKQYAVEKAWWMSARA